MPSHSPRDSTLFLDRSYPASIVVQFPVLPIVLPFPTQLPGFPNDPRFGQCLPAPRLWLTADCPFTSPVGPICHASRPVLLRQCLQFVVKRLSSIFSLAYLVMSSSNGSPSTCFRSYFAAVVDFFQFLHPRTRKTVPSSCDLPSHFAFFLAPNVPFFAAVSLKPTS